MEQDLDDLDKYFQGDERVGKRYFVDVNKTVKRERLNNQQEDEENG